MNQSAQPAGATTSDSSTEVSRAVGLSTLKRAWAMASAPNALVGGADAVIRPRALALIVPPVLCAIALLFAQGAPLNWIVAIFTLLACALSVAGIGALASARRAAGATGGAETSASSINPAIMLITLACLCALPLLMASAQAATLAIVLALVTFALFGFDETRKRIAPLDEIIAPLSLGPGIFCLAVLAQRQPMTGPRWLVAAALGAMSFAVVEGLRLRKGGARTLAGVLGARIATMLLGLALLVSYALALVIAVPKSGWPGALLCLVSAPLALIGYTGLRSSQFLPGRYAAARQLVRAYLWYGLALAVGLAATYIARTIIAAILKAVGA